MEMRLDAIQRGTYEGTLTAGVLALKNIFMPVLRTTNFLGNTLESSPLLNRLNFGTH